MLLTLGMSDRESFSAFLAKTMTSDQLPLPSTVITDSEGRTLEVMQGVPTLSLVRRRIPGKNRVIRFGKL